MRLVASVFLLLPGCVLDWSITPLPDGGSDAAADAPGEAGDAADCTSLAASLAAARQSAKQCTSTAGACTATMTDECGCTINVGTAGSTADQAYQQAIGTFVTAGCTPTCSACTSPTPGLCEVGPGLMTYCMPL